MTFGIGSSRTDATQRSGDLAPAVNALSLAVDDLDARLIGTTAVADEGLSIAETAKSKNDSQDTALQSILERLDALEEGVGTGGGGSAGGGSTSSPSATTGLWLFPSLPMDNAKGARGHLGFAALADGIVLAKRGETKWFEPKYIHLHETGGPLSAAPGLTLNSYDAESASLTLTYAEIPEGTTFVIYANDGDPFEVAAPGTVEVPRPKNLPDPISFVAYAVDKYGSEGQGSEPVVVNFGTPFTPPAEPAPMYLAAVGDVPSGQNRAVTLAVAPWKAFETSGAVGPDADTTLELLRGGTVVATLAPGDPGHSAGEFTDDGLISGQSYTWVARKRVGGAVTATSNQFTYVAGSGLVPPRITGIFGSVTTWPDGGQNYSLSYAPEHENDTLLYLLRDGEEQVVELEITTDTGYRDGIIGTGQTADNHALHHHAGETHTYRLQLATKDLTRSGPFGLPFTVSIAAGNVITTS